MAKETLFWHDYETFGTSPKFDKPSQFAGVRTDMDLNIIDEPVNVYCKPANDFLPHPIACKITGVTPQEADEKGVSEAEFMEAVHQELSKGGTCGVGYNSISFDDEVTRFGLFRNFYDPYAREWQNGCSRWDVLNLMRLTYLVYPDTLNWPQDDEGNISFRLENLSVANGIIHENAHEALSDVTATIDLVKKIKEKQPKLFDYFYNLRLKKFSSDVTTKNDMLMHVDATYGRINNFMGIVHPIVKNPNNQNEWLVIDLNRDDLQDLIDLDIEEIGKRAYSTKIELEERGVARPGLNRFAINKCPAIVTPKVFRDPNRLQALGFDIEKCQRNLQFIKSHPELASKLVQMYKSDFPEEKDVDASLYNGFIDKKDRYALDDLRRTKDFEKPRNFVDPKFHEMMFRYKARNYNHLLTDVEEKKWDEYRLTRIREGGSLTFNEYLEHIELMVNEDSSHLPMAKKLIDYAKSVGDESMKLELEQFEKKTLKSKSSKPKP